MRTRYYVCLDDIIVLYPKLLKGGRDMFNNVSYMLFTDTFSPLGVNKFENVTLNKYNSIVDMVLWANTSTPELSLSLDTTKQKGMLNMDNPELLSDLMISELVMMNIQVISIVDEKIVEFDMTSGHRRFVISKIIK